MRRISRLSLQFLMLVFISASFTASGAKVIKNTDSIASVIPSVAVEDMTKEFNSLSKQDKKAKLKEIKKAIKKYRNEKKAGGDISTNALLLILIAILVPPLAVYLHEGEINNKFWISVLLTLLGYLLFNFAGIFFLSSLPGLIYALYVIFSGTSASRF